MSLFLRNYSRSHSERVSYRRVCNPPVIPYTTSTINSHPSSISFDDKTRFRVKHDAKHPANEERILKL